MFATKLKFASSLAVMATLTLNAFVLLPTADAKLTLKRGWGSWFGRGNRTPQPQQTDGHGPVDADGVPQAGHPAHALVMDIVRESQRDHRAERRHSAVEAERRMTRNERWHAAANAAAEPDEAPLRTAYRWAQEMMAEIEQERRERYANSGAQAAVESIRDDMLEAGMNVEPVTTDDEPPSPPMYAAVANPDARSAPALGVKVVNDKNLSTSTKPKKTNTGRRDGKENENNSRSANANGYVENYVTRVGGTELVSATRSLSEREVAAHVRDLNQTRRQRSTSPRAQRTTLEELLPNTNEIASMRVAGLPVPSAYPYTGHNVEAREYAELGIPVLSDEEAEAVARQVRLPGNVYLAAENGLLIHTLSGWRRTNLITDLTRSVEEIATDFSQMQLPVLLYLPRNPRATGPRGEPKFDGEGSLIPDEEYRSVLDVNAKRFGTQVIDEEIFRVVNGARGPRPRDEIDSRIDRQLTWHARHPRYEECRSCVADCCSPIVCTVSWAFGLLGWIYIMIIMFSGPDRETDDGSNATIVTELVNATMGDAGRRLLMNATAQMMSLPQI